METFCPHVETARGVLSTVDGQPLLVVVHHGHPFDTPWHKNDSISLMHTTDTYAEITDLYRMIPGNARKLTAGLLMALDAAENPDPATRAAAQVAEAQRVAGNPPPELAAECEHIEVVLQLISPDESPSDSSITVYTHFGHALPGHRQTRVGVLLDHGTGQPLRSEVTPDEAKGLVNILLDAVLNTLPDDDTRYDKLGFSSCMTRISLQYDRGCATTIAVAVHRPHEHARDWHRRTAVSLCLAPEGRRAARITMSPPQARSLLRLLRETARLANQLPGIRREFTTEADRLEKAGTVRAGSPPAVFEADVHYGHEGAGDEGHKETFVVLRARPGGSRPDGITCELRPAEVHYLILNLTTAVQVAELPREEWLRPEE